MDIAINETNALMRIIQGFGMLLLFFCFVMMTRTAALQIAKFDKNIDKDLINSVCKFVAAICAGLFVVKLFIILTQSPKVTLRANIPTFTEMREQKIRDLSPPVKDFDQRIKEFDQIELAPVR